MAEEVNVVGKKRRGFNGVLGEMDEELLFFFLLLVVLFNNDCWFDRGDDSLLFFFLLLVILFSNCDCF